MIRNEITVRNETAEIRTVLAEAAFGDGPTVVIDADSVTGAAFDLATLCRISDGAINNIVRAALSITLTAEQADKLRAKVRIPVDPTALTNDQILAEVARRDLLADNIVSNDVPALTKRLAELVKDSGMLWSHTFKALMDVCDDKESTIGDLLDGLPRRQLRDVLSGRATWEDAKDNDNLDADTIADWLREQGWTCGESADDLLGEMDDSDICDYLQTNGWTVYDQHAGTDDILGEIDSDEIVEFVRDNLGYVVVTEEEGEDRNRELFDLIPLAAHVELMLGREACKAGLIGALRQQGLATITTETLCAMHGIINAARLASQDITENLGGLSEALPQPRVAVPA